MANNYGNLHKEMSDWYVEGFKEKRQMSQCWSPRLAPGCAQTPDPWAVVAIALGPLDAQSRQSQPQLYILINSG